MILPVVRPVTFLSDYGVVDEFVGVVHGVIARIAPDARVLDVSHGVPPQDVRAGALMLARALPFLPAGVHLAVVDPGVGTRRRAVAARTADDDRILVGPDNGLLLPAAARFGGVRDAVEISASPWRLQPVSATFHGRDVFAPVAARLAAGAALEDAGAALDPAELVALDVPVARRDGPWLVVPVVGVDGFGNLLLAADGADAAAVGLRPGARADVQTTGAGGRAHVGRVFADVPSGALLLYEDASGALSVACNGGSAADVLGVRADDELRLRALP